MKKDMSRPIEESAQHASDFVSSGVGGQQDKIIGVKVRDLFLNVLTRGHWDFLVGASEIVMRWLSDPLVMFLRKRIGEREFNWIIVLSSNIILGIIGFFASLVGPFIGVGYEYYLYAFYAKAYILAAIIQYASILYRKHFGDPSNMVYSFSMGNSIFYGKYLVLSTIIKHKALSESQFQKYVECGVVIIIGLVLSSVFGIGFGKFLIFSGLALFLTIVQRENRFREKILDSTDARIVNDQLMHHMSGKKSTPANNQGFPMADVIVNEAKRAYGEQITDAFTEDLERLKVEQKLEDEPQQTSEE